MQDGSTYTVNCSFYELYKEVIKDLLQPSREKTLQVRVDPEGGPFVEHLSSERQVKSGRACQACSCVTGLAWLLAFSQHSLR